LVAGAAASVPEGIASAARAIDSGDAKRVLEKMVAISNAEDAAGAGA
jgi:anthranilate phosphoribosyltransferase